jgi:hypothetical protein
LVRINSRIAENWIKRCRYLTQINQLFHPVAIKGTWGGPSAAHALTNEGFEMFRRKGLLSSVSRNVAIATTAVLALTIAEPSMAKANPVKAVAKGLTASAPSSGATDFSARRRYHRHYHRGNAAGLAVMGMMIGTIGAAIAAEQRRDAYCDYYGPGYYAPPAYYGYGPYYGHRYYRYYPY